MAEEYKKSISGWRTSLKNVAAEDSPENNAKKLNLFTSHEGNFQHHYVCLFFWAAPSSNLQNWARVSNAIRAIISMKLPHYWKSSEGIYNSCVVLCRL